MKAEATRKKQDTLNSLILELAKEPLEDDQDKLKSKALDFKDIYSDDFHHLYSEFLPLITQIFNYNEYNPEILVTNLESIKVFVEADYQKVNNLFNESELNPIRKLCDHINLEVARMNYSTSTYQLLKSTTAELESTKKELQESREKVQEATEKLKDSQGHVVAILSIFAAIVITFAGGISLFGSALSSVSSAPLLPLLLVIFSCGLVLLDSVTALIYAVSKIVDKSILIKCENDKCNCKNKKGKSLCKGLTKIRKRLPVVFWVNILLFLLILVVAIIYILNKLYEFI